MTTTTAPAARVSHETPQTSEPGAFDALVIPLIPCAPWCEKGDGHGGEHPEDRHCWSTFQTVPNTLAKPQRYTDDLFRYPWLNVYLRREWREETSHAVIHCEDTDAEIKLSLGEARQLRDHLSALLATEETGA